MFNFLRPTIKQYTIDLEKVRTRKPGEVYVLTAPDASIEDLEHLSRWLAMLQNLEPGHTPFVLTSEGLSLRVVDSNIPLFRRVRIPAQSDWPKCGTCGNEIKITGETCFGDHKRGKFYAVSCGSIACSNFGTFGEYKDARRYADQLSGSFKCT